MSRSDWINAVSAIAILVGLIFVFVELRQSRDIAEAQLSAEIVFGSQNWNLQLMGENAAAITAKVCYQPTELTPAEMETFEATNRALWAQLRLRHGIHRNGLLTEVGAFKDYVRGVAGAYLGTPLGRYQWSQDRKWIGTNDYPDLIRIFDDVAEAIPKGECAWASRYQDYIELAKSGDI